MNKTPITDACFLAQGEPPEALIERLRKAAILLEGDNDKLRAFANKVMEVRPDYGIDGGELQEHAIEFGLIAPHEAKEACGEGCNCAQYVSDWPTTCYRPTALLTGGEEKP